MLRLILAMMFTFFLPGYTLINAIYPGKGELDEELDTLYRVMYGLGVSAAIFIFIGFILGNISVRNGLFTGSYLWFSLISLTIIFFLIGWYRGGYQTLSLLSHKLTRPKSEVTHEKDEGIKKVKGLQEIAKKRGALKEKIRYSEGEEKQRLKEELEKLEDSLKEAEKDREDDF